MPRDAAFGLNGIGGFRMQAWLCVMALGVAFGAASGAAAETLRLRADRFDEQLTDRVRTSGSLLAGVYVGRMSDLFQPGAIGLPVGSGSRGEMICLRVASRDGRYRGLAQYRVATDAVATPVLEFNTAYMAALTRMPLSQIAARITRAATCTDAVDGPIIPAVLGSSGALSADARRLVILLNPGEARVTARLLSAAGEALGTEANRCTRLAEGASIVFSHACELALPQPSAGSRVNLELVIIELADGRSVRKFDLDLSGL